MRGNYFLGKGKFEVRETGIPEIREDEVLVQVAACGICGTDVHIYHGEKGSAEVTPPVVLGHEFAGVVVRTGAKVTRVQPGDHVTADPNRYCGACRPCRMGRKQNCEHLFALGVNVNGGFEEYVAVPEAQCFRVDPEIPLDVAAMAEPLACVIHGIDLCHIQPGMNVLVIGGGTIGQMMLQMARLSGAARVLLSEPIEMRREMALRFGADAAFDPIHEDPVACVEKLTCGEGADVIIECVGRPFAVEQALKVAGNGTMILLFSVPGVEDTVQLPLFDVYKKELKISGSMINPDTHQRAVNLINGRRLHLQELITHHYGLEGLEEGIHMQMSAESIKVVVHPQE